MWRTRGGASYQSLHYDVNLTEPFVKAIDTSNDFWQLSVSQVNACWVANMNHWQVSFESINEKTIKGGLGCSPQISIFSPIIISQYVRR